MSDHDQVKSPSHYTWHPSGVQPKDIARHCSYNIGTAIAYIWRHEHKGTPVDDLRKAALHLTDEVDNVIGDLETVMVNGPLSSGIELRTIRAEFPADVQVILGILWTIGTRSTKHNEHDIAALSEAAFLCDKLADDWEAAK